MENYIKGNPKYNEAVWEVLLETKEKSPGEIVKAFAKLVTPQLGDIAFWEQFRLCYNICTAAKNDEMVPELFKIYEANKDRTAKRCFMTELEASYYRLLDDHFYSYTLLTPEEIKLSPIIPTYPSAFSLSFMLAMHDADTVGDLKITVIRTKKTEKSVFIIPHQNTYYPYFLCAPEDVEIKTRGATDLTIRKALQCGVL